MLSNAIKLDINYFKIIEKVNKIALNNLRSGCVAVTPHSLYELHCTIQFSPNLPLHANPMEGSGPPFNTSFLGPIQAIVPIVW